MSSEVHELSDVARGILRLLMSGMQTTERTKSGAELEPEAMAVHLGVPPELVQEQLNVLEVLGYVVNDLDTGDDPTMGYKRLDDGTVADTGDERSRKYYISEWGKRLVVADAASDDAT